MFEVTLLIQSEGETVEVPLDGHSLTIGRDDSAELVINDSGLSRLHASIHREAEAVWIVDENSTNGTHVNGRSVPLDGMMLGDGDEISLGDETTIIIVICRNASPAPRTKIRIKDEHSTAAPFAPVRQTNVRQLNHARPWWSSPVFIAALSGIIVVTLISFVIIGVYHLAK